MNKVAMSIAWIGFLSMGLFLMFLVEGLTSKPAVFGFIASLVITACSLMFCERMD